VEVVHLIVGVDILNRVAVIITLNIRCTPHSINQYQHILHEGNDRANNND
jgi:hypothetical protein